jgi:tRNA threonylcarbamoyladenosine biosynthesis protein TsaB
MKILALDTSRKNFVLGFAGKTFTGENQKSQNEELLSSVVSFLRENAASVHDLQAIGVVIGPGSFTGLRIGVMCAKTLAWALKVPLYAFNRLDLIADTSNHHGHLLSSIDAWRGSFYAGLYLQKKRIGKNYFEIETADIPKCLSLNASWWESKNLPTPENLLWLGDVSMNFQSHPNVSKESMDNLSEKIVRSVLRQTQEKINAGEPGVDPLVLTPFYQRASEAEILYEKNSEKTAP